MSGSEYWAGILMTMARLNDVPEETQPSRVGRRGERVNARPTRQQREQQSDQQYEDQHEDREYRTDYQSHQRSDPQNARRIVELHEPPSEATTSVDVEGKCAEATVVEDTIVGNTVVEYVVEDTGVEETAVSCLTTEPKSMVELEAVFHSTDLEQFLATSDLKKALDVGRKIIIARSQVAETVTSQCAIDISVVWKAVDELNSTHPDELASITRWKGDISRQLQSQDNGKDIDHYIGLAEQTSKRLSQYSKRIFNKWGVLPTQLLSKDKYREKRPLSKGTLQAMARLADLTSREEGQKTLTDIIERRSSLDGRSAYQEGRSSYQRLDPYLSPADILAAIEAEKDKKRAHNETGSDAESKDLIPLLPLAKRRRGRPKGKHTTSLRAEKLNDDKDEAVVSSLTGCSPRTAVSDQHNLDSTNATGLSQPSTPTRVGLTMSEMSFSTIELPRKAPIPMFEFQPSDMSDFQLDSVASTPRSSLREHQYSQDISSPAFPRRQDTDSAIFMDDPLDSKSETPLNDHGTVQKICPPESQLRQVAESPIRVVDDGAPNPNAEQFPPDKGAVLATVSPGRKLSSTAVHDSLKFFVSDDCHLIDPLFFNSTFPDRLNLRRPLTDKVNRIFMPLHDAQLVHWTLVVIKFDDASIQVYDSLAPTSIDRVLAKRLREFAQGVAPQSQVWTLQQAICPKQSNDYDCGVHVIANGVFLMTKMGLPHHHDCHAWRLVCRTLLGDGIEDPNLDELPRFDRPDGGLGGQALQEAVNKSMLHTVEDVLAVVLGSTCEFVETFSSDLQAQTEQLKAVHNSAVAIMKVIEDVHRQRDLEARSLDEQFMEYVRRYSEHESLLAKYSEVANGFLSQDVLSSMRSSVQSTQAAVKNQLNEKATRNQSAHASMLKSKALVEVVRQITQRYHDQLSVLEAVEQEHLQTVRTWERMMADTVRKLRGLLEKHDRTMAETSAGQAAPSCI